MPTPRAMLNQIIDDRRQVSRNTGSRPTVPPPQPGLPSGRPQVSEGDKSGWTTKALSPPIWTTGQVIVSAGTASVYWSVASSSASVPVNPYGDAQAKYTSVGGKPPATPGANGGQSSPSTTTVLQGDSIANPDPGYTPATTGDYYDSSDYAAS